MSSHSYGLTAACLFLLLLLVFVYYALCFFLLSFHWKHLCHTPTHTHARARLCWPPIIFALFITSTQYIELLSEQWSASMRSILFIGNANTGEARRDSLKHDNGLSFIVFTKLNIPLSSSSYHRDFMYIYCILLMSKVMVGNNFFHSYRRPNEMQTVWQIGKSFVG